MTIKRFKANWFFFNHSIKKPRPIDFRSASPISSILKISSVFPIPSWYAALSLCWISFNNIILLRTSYEYTVYTKHKYWKHIDAFVSVNKRCMNSATEDRIHDFTITESVFFFPLFVRTERRKDKKKNASFSLSVNRLGDLHFGHARAYTFDPHKCITCEHYVQILNVFLCECI